MTDGASRPRVRAGLRVLAEAMPSHASEFLFLFRIKHRGGAGVYPIGGGCLDAEQ